MLSCTRICVYTHDNLISQTVVDVLSVSLSVFLLAGSILSVESNRNVKSKTKNVDSKTGKCGIQNSIWSVDSQENH